MCDKIIWVKFLRDFIMLWRLFFDGKKSEMEDKIWSCFSENKTKFAYFRSKSGVLALKTKNPDFENLKNNNSTSISVTVDR